MSIAGTGLAGGGLSGGQGVSIARPTGRCAASGAPLTQGDRFVAALVERAGGAVDREDFAASAWDSGARPSGPLIAFWRGVMPASTAKAPARLDNAELLELFERLGSEVEGQGAALRYVLALLLIRRRVLRYAGEKAGVLRLSDGAEGPLIEVKDPGLDPAALSAVAERFGELAGLETAGGTGRA